MIKLLILIIILLFTILFSLMVKIEDFCGTKTCTSDNDCTQGMKCSSGCCK